MGKHEERGVNTDGNGVELCHCDNVIQERVWTINCSVDPTGPPGIGKKGMIQKSCQIFFQKFWKFWICWILLNFVEILLKFCSKHHVILGFQNRGPKFKFKKETIRPVSRWLVGIVCRVFSLREVLPPQLPFPSSLFEACLLPPCRAARRRSMRVGTMTCGINLRRYASKI